MTVLVTGAHGWLGTRLVEVLYEDSKRKTCCLVQSGVDMPLSAKPEHV